jgi:hypothetical protein
MSLPNTKSLFPPEIFPKLQFLGKQPLLNRASLEFGEKRTINRFSTLSGAFFFFCLTPPPPPPFIAVQVSTVAYFATKA